MEVLAYAIKYNLIELYPAMVFILYLDLVFT